MTDIAAAPRIAVPQQLDIGLLAGFDPAATIVDMGGDSMGTRWRVRLALPVRQTAEPLRQAITARLDAIVVEMSHWSPTSLLSRFNRAPAGSWTDLPPDFATVMTAGLAIAAHSDGAFDPTLGRLTDLWGLGATQRFVQPSSEAIAEARAASGWRRTRMATAPARLFQPGGLCLDLSGIAKGYAVDAVAALLIAHGRHHALVEIGGECRGLGIRPDGDPWWVDVETPASQAAPLRIALHQLAVATSGDYVRGVHMLDPHSGHPVERGPMAVTVLHRSTMIADAWASALTILPPAEAQAAATGEALAVRIIAHDGSEWLSPALQDMF